MRVGQCCGWKLIDCANILQVQIHGPVSLSENVDCIVANSCHRTYPKTVLLLNKFVEKNQCKLVWMDQLPHLPDIPSPSIPVSRPRPSASPIPTPFSRPQQGQGRAITFPRPPIPTRASPSRPFHHKTIPVPRPPIPAPVSQSQPPRHKTTPVSRRPVPTPVSQPQPLHSKTSPAPRPTIPVQQRQRFRHKTSPSPRFPSAATYDTDSSFSSDDGYWEVDFWW